MFSVNVLLYGDHLHLTQRCLNSIAASAEWSLIDEIRIGCNELSQPSRSYAEFIAHQMQVPVWFFTPQQEKIGKYPLMRRMLYEPTLPIKSSHIMWFDDDTYLRDPPTKSWWYRVAALAQIHDMVGKRYRITANTPLIRAIEAQTWYMSKPLPHTRQIQFCQGGWWVAAYDRLKRWDYPFRELYHNGGDVILGELARQQGWTVRDYNEGIAINADEKGIESGAKRRGLTTTPLWRDHNPSLPPNYAHQIFDYVLAPGNKRATRHSLDRPGP